MKNKFASKKRRKKLGPKQEVEHFLAEQRPDKIAQREAMRAFVLGALKDSPPESAGPVKSTQG